jgi:hypothetical protein
MDFQKIFAKTAIIGKKVVDIGAIVGVPGMTQLDAIAEAIDRSQAQSHEKEAMQARLDILRTMPVAMDEPSDRVNALDSKRFKMALAGIIATVLAHWKLAPDVAMTISEFVAGIVLIYIGGDTLRPSTRSQ